jgi:predicted acyl esterase
MIDVTANLPIIIERNVSCTVSDGTALATDVFRPDDNERHPVLLQRTPYDKGFHPFTWAAADPLRLAASGYVVAIQDVRGRHASDGTYDDLYLHEEADGADAVEWAATQPWSAATSACTASPIWEPVSGWPRSRVIRPCAHLPRPPRRTT